MDVANEEAANSVNSITWDDSYAIARRLIREHPGIDIEKVSLGMIHDWVVALPEFSDDPDMVNDGILMGIIQELYEEVTK